MNPNMNPDEYIQASIENYQDGLICVVELIGKLQAAWEEIGVSCQHDCLVCGYHNIEAVIEPY